MMQSPGVPQEASEQILNETNWAELPENRSSFMEMVPDIPLEASEQ